MWASVRAFDASATASRLTPSVLRYYLHGFSGAHPAPDPETASIEMDELRPGFLVTPAVKLLRPLGQGGMGKVWVAEHTGLKTEVVVKFMAKNVEDHADAAARFSREASVAASVKSPHVVQVFDYGLTQEGIPYIVMELLEGRDLAAYLDANGPMAPRDVAALVAQIGKALGKAHQVGVIHRDIKPDNIFLCDAEGGELFAKLLDFGIAKREQILDASATTTGLVVGTPYYMSPEQIVGEKDIDARSDIWSLGVVAFEAITGRRPFDGSTVGAITLAIHTKRPKISEHRTDVPAAVDAWFLKACAQDPKERFATAREASLALLEAVGEAAGPALVRPPMQSSSFGLGDSDPGLSRTIDPEPELAASAEMPAAKKPSKALLGGAVAAVLLLGLVAAFAMKSTDEPKPGAVSPPPSVALPEIVASASASTTAATAPAPSATALPTMETAKPAAANIAPATAKPAVGAPRVRPKKPANDDDIK